MPVPIRKYAAAFAFCHSRLYAVAGAVLLGAPVMAQSAGEGPLVLRLPVSARVAALANAGLAGTDGDAFLYNPGILPVARGSAASVQRYGSSGTAGAFGTIMTAGSLTLGYGAQFVDWSAPSGVSYAEALRAGHTQLAESGGVPASSSAFTIGVGRSLKRVRVGTNVKYAEDRVGLAKAGVVAFDVGMSLSAGPGTLGVVLQNLGTAPRVAGETGSLPTRLGIGLGGGPMPLSERWDIGAQMQLSVERDWFVRPAGGVELGYVPIDGVAVVLRTGLRLPRERDESLVTGGLGITVDRLSLDYAMEPVRGGRPVSHRIGLRVR